MDKKICRNANKSFFVTFQEKDILKKTNLINDKLIRFCNNLKFINIACYIALKDEPKIDLFLKWLITNNKKIYLPFYNASQKGFSLWDYHEDLKFNKIYKNISDLNVIDLFIIPCLGFNYDLYRLGRGGGFYDDLFTKVQSNIMKVGVCWKEGLVDFQEEEHDQQLDLMITD